jgi:hypothetical protein
LPTNHIAVTITLFVVVTVAHPPPFLPLPSLLPPSPLPSLLLATLITVAVALAALVLAMRRGKYLLQYLLDKKYFKKKTI